MRLQTDTTPENGPLQGVRILDLSTALAVPMATAMLADQGAQVTKVEAPGIGDILRYVGLARNGVTSAFQAANRGKRALALDIRRERGRETLLALMAQTDVVTHNFRPGVAERLKISYEQLREHNPQLIYASVSGYGVRGPKAKQRAYDNVVQTFSGITYNQRNIDTGEPTPNYQAIVDKLTSMNVYQAVTAALLARERGRGGQKIDIAMVDCILSFLWPEASKGAGFLDAEGDISGIDISEPLRLTRFRNGWGNFAPLSDSEFFGTCRAFGVDVSDNAAVADVASRAINREAVIEVMDRVTEAALEIDVDEAMARLEAEDVPCSKAMRIEDLPRHPQIEANESFVETQHPVAGRLCEPRNPARFSQTPSGVGAPSPQIGQHSDEILREHGFDERAIEALRAEQIIA